MPSSPLSKTEVYRQLREAGVTVIDKMPGDSPLAAITDTPADFASYDQPAARMEPMPGEVGRGAEILISIFDPNPRVTFFHRYLGPTAQYGAATPTMFSNGPTPRLIASGLDPRLVMFVRWELRHSAGFANAQTCSS